MGRPGTPEPGTVWQGTWTALRCQCWVRHSGLRRLTMTEVDTLYLPVTVSRFKFTVTSAVLIDSPSHPPSGRRSSPTGPCRHCKLQADAADSHRDATPSQLSCHFSCAGWGCDTSDNTDTQAQIQGKRERQSLFRTVRTNQTLDTARMTALARSTSHRRDA